MFETALLKACFIFVRALQLILSLISIGLFARSLDNISFTRFSTTTAQPKLVASVALSGIVSFYTCITFLLACFGREVFFFAAMVVDLLLMAAFIAVVVVVEPRKMPYCMTLEMLLIEGKEETVADKVFKSLKSKCAVTRAGYAVAFVLLFLFFCSFIISISEWYMKRRIREEEEIEETHSRHSGSIHREKRRHSGHRSRSRSTSTSRH